MLARAKLPALFVAVIAIGCFSWQPAEAKWTWEQCMESCKLTAQHCIVIMPRTDAERKNNKVCDENLRECRHGCNR